MFHRSKLPSFVVLLFLLAALFAEGPVFSAPNDPVPVDGCIVLELTSPDQLPLNSKTNQGWDTGYNAVNKWLMSIEAWSLKQEYGDLLPQYRVLRYNPDLPTTDVLAELKKFSFVANAWGNIAFPMSQQLSYTPNDPLIPSQWHLEAIHASRGWALSQGSRDVIVGIVDSGVNYNHEDLAPSIWINPDEDLNGDGIWEPDVDADGIDNDNNGYVDDGIGWDWVTTSTDNMFPGEDGLPADNDPSDFNGHGTHCAGDAVAATGNAIGVASPGAGCRVAALRAGWSVQTGQGVVGLSEAASAIAYAVDKEFSVISMSFGGSGGDPSFFTDAMIAARDAGLLLVAAAGNEATTTRSYPAAYSYVIGVAATNPQNHLANFSNRGDWVTISAPGAFIYSTVNGGGYGAMSGTSMACPVTAGALANLMSITPNWTTEQYLMRIGLSSTPMSDPGSGEGLLNLGALLDPFVSIDSLAVLSDAGSGLVHDTPATLRLRYAKLDGAASDVSLTLSSEEERVLLEEDSHWIGSIAGTGNGYWEVPIEVEGNGSNREEVKLNARFRGSDALGGEFDYTQPIYLQVGTGDVLFIDADEGGEGRLDLWYTAPLNALGLAVDVVSLDDLSDLEERLDGYEAAILATGNRTSSPFRDGDVDVWSAYVRQGGHWLLTGQNVAEALNTSDPEVLDTLLQASFVSAHSNRLVAKGIENNPLADGIDFTLAGDGGAWNQTSLDVIAAGSFAEPLLVYNLDVMDELAGLRVQRGSGELVFCSFGLEAVNDSLSNKTTRYRWFDKLFRSWDFQVDVPDQQDNTSAPAQFTLGNSWPNPTNGTVTVPFTLLRGGRVEVKVVNRIGRQVASWSQRAHAGNNRISWKMPEHLSSGVYLVSLTSGSTTLTSRVVLVK